MIGITNINSPPKWLHKITPFSALIIRRNAVWLLNAKHCIVDLGVSIRLFHCWNLITLTMHKFNSKGKINFECVLDAATYVKINKYTRVCFKTGSTWTDWNDNYFCKTKLKFFILKANTHFGRPACFSLRSRNTRDLDEI